MIVAPLGDTIVEMPELPVRPHEIREKREQDAAADHDGERERQCQTRRRGGIEPSVQPTANGRVMRNRPSDRLSDGDARSSKIMVDGTVDSSQRMSGSDQDSRYSLVYSSKFATSTPGGWRISRRARMYAAVSGGTSSAYT